MSSKLALLAVLALLCCATSEASRILFFFPSGAFSHKVSVWPLVSELANRGHNVTFLSGYGKAPFKNPKIQDLESPTLKERLKSYYDIDRLGLRQAGKAHELYDKYNEAVVDICQLLFRNSRSDPVLKKVIYDEPYDLVVNNFVLSDCGLIVANRKKAKLVIYMSSPWFSWINEEIGMPVESSWIPDVDRIKVHYPMGLWDRIQNYFRPMIWYYSRLWHVYPELEKIMADNYDFNGTQVPSLMEVQKNASLMLLASHYGTDFARSLPPWVVQVGGMQCWLEYEPLNKEFQDLLDKATNGAVLIAFGSTVNLATMPQYFKDMFFEMMRQFSDIQFIWRWDGPVPENLPKNLVVSKWLQQFQILGHPNLKAFVSHAGLNSLTEATYHGVPVILLPLFADQDFNGYRIEATEVGIRLEGQGLVLDGLLKAVRSVLYDPKYTNNMRTMSSMMRDRPMKPVDTAAYWIEFVLRHDNLKSLKPLQHLEWYQRRYWDFLAVLLVAASAVLAALSLLVWSLIAFVSANVASKSSSTNPEKKKN